MAQLIFILVLTLFFPTLSSASVSDPNATAETVKLYDRLQCAKGGPYLWGYQTPGMYNDNSDICSKRSESFNISGKDPLIWGFQFKMADSGSQNYMKRLECINLAKRIYRAGGIIYITFSPGNYVTGGNQYDSTGSPVINILPAGSARTSYLADLDQLSELLQSLTDDEGNLIPVLLKPWAECDGGWFYWSCYGSSTSGYISLWQDMVDYLRNTKNIHSILYMYSPDFGYNGNGAQDGYPGDDYVDLIGVNNYENTIANVMQYYEEGVALALDHDKIFGISEGLKSNPDTATYWMDFLNMILSNSTVSKNLSFIFFWSSDIWGPKSGRVDSESYISFVNNPKIKTLSKNALRVNTLNLNGLRIQ